MNPIASVTSLRRAGIASGRRLSAPLLPSTAGAQREMGIRILLHGRRLFLRKRLRHMGDQTTDAAATMTAYFVAVFWYWLALPLATVIAGWSLYGLYRVIADSWHNWRDAREWEQKVGAGAGSPSGRVVIPRTAASPSKPYDQDTAA